MEGFLSSSSEGQVHPVRTHYQSVGVGIFISAAIVLSRASLISQLHSSQSRSLPGHPESFHSFVLVEGAMYLTQHKGLHWSYDKSLGWILKHRPLFKCYLFSMWELAIFFVQL